MKKVSKVSMKTSERTPAAQPASLFSVQVRNAFQRVVVLPKYCAYIFPAGLWTFKEGDNASPTHCSFSPESKI